MLEESEERGVGGTSERARETKLGEDVGEIGGREEGRDVAVGHRNALERSGGGRGRRAGWRVIG